MALFGRVDEFDPEQTGADWGQYIERLEHYFLANDIDTAAKQKAILLTACGAKTYKMMCDLLAPEKPGGKTFAELKEAMNKHIHPKPSEIVQRYKFHTHHRKEDESVSTFVSQLRHLSKDCNFGATLDLMLRDRLVCGINNDRIQRRLLSEKDLTFAKAFDIATGLELAQKSAADLQSADRGEKTILKTAEEQGSSGGNRDRKADGGSGGEINFVRKPRSPKDVECWYCHTKGHVMRFCEKRLTDRKERLARKEPRFRNKQSQGASKMSWKHEAVKNIEDSDSDAEVYTVFKTQSREKPYVVQMQVNGVLIEMEVDTGASLTVISEETYKLIRRGDLKQSTKELKTYTGQQIPVLGVCSVSVSYQDREPKELEIVVVKGEGPSLVGRDWLSEIKLDWTQIFSVHATTQVDSVLTQILQDFSAVFEETRGTIQGTKAAIFVDPTAKPRYFKPRPVPYALRDKVSKELDRLEAEGTIEKVQFSDWAAPIVTVVKPDKSLRICGDYKVTVNEVSKLDNYPIPKTDDLLAELGGGKFFTKLDLSQAYQQLELEESSKQYTTINTHQGLYRYHRLPYGISSAPGIFQRTMENILKGIQNVHVRVDDILVAGQTREEHLRTLREVLKRLADAGARLKKSKCVFMASEVVYLGLKIDGNGVQPVPEKVKAITEMPRPTDVKQLQAYLGMVNYYSRFLPHLSATLAPLYHLLKKGVSWSWGTEQEQAWKQSTLMLQSPKVLTHFDSSKDIVLTCDASAYGIGAVISHRMEDGSERPVAYTSRTLNAAEKNYSQIEKEALAIVHGVKKFHQYLYGQKFEINTDHKPLLGLFKENRQVPAMAAARIQRWALLLAAYEYTIRYKEGTKLSNADGLSRLPLEKSLREQPEPGETVLLMEQVETMPVTAKQISQWTRSDPVLARVKDFVQKGWPESNSDVEMKPYFVRRMELSVVDGCILWGSRVVVPPRARKVLLRDLHDSHPGMNRMKSLARSYIWWPLMDSDIEKTVRNCEVCQTNRNTPTTAPLHPWEWPGRPWSRLHLDYAGPLYGKMFLVLIDAHSKWLDVYPVNHATSTTTIEKLRQSFAIHGLPETVVTDNGTCFTSEEFQIFMKRNGIKHITSAPYHPSTNGLAERGVQTLKQGLQKMKQGSIETRVSRLLSAYRVTPQSTTGLSPSELLFNRRVRTRLDLVQPCLERKVVEKQLQQKLNHDSAPKRSFGVGDLVYMKNFTGGSKWIPGVVSEVTGPLSYVVTLPDGRTHRRHIDQLLSRESSTEHLCRGKTLSYPPTMVLPDEHQAQEQTHAPADLLPPETVQPPVEMTQEAVFPEPTAANPAVTTSREVVQRPEREKKRPVKFKDFVVEW